MKRSGLVLGALPLITAVSIGAGGVAPGRAEEAPAKSPETQPTSGTSTGATDLSEKEKALLQKINALKAPRWRPFGACRYDWAAWKLMADGVRTTNVQCGPETADTTNGSSPTASVAVHCDTLKLSVRSGDQAWSSWRLPYGAAESKERGGEDLMVASLCANAKPIPKPQPAPPPAVTPAGKPAAKPIATPATKTATPTPAQKSPATKR